MLVKARSDINAANVQGSRCLHQIAHFGAHRILENVLLRGVHVNAVDELGCTPLHLASSSENGWVVMEALLKLGTNPEAEGYKGSTPLHVGCCSGRNEAVLALLNHRR